MWYVKDCPELADLRASGSLRIDETFRLTKVSRELLVFQVQFLDIAKPTAMNLKQICEKYDSNYGLPTTEMEAAMKGTVKLIKKICNFREWFEAIKIPPLTNNELVDWLIDSVKSAQSKPGYYRKDNQYNSSYNNRNGKRDYDDRGRGDKYNYNAKRNRRDY